MKTLNLEKRSKRKRKAEVIKENVFGLWSVKKRKLEPGDGSNELPAGSPIFASEKKEKKKRKPNIRSTHMKIPVIGCGRWGSFIAWYLDSIGHEVSLYGRRGSKHMEAFESTRTNGLVTLNDSIALRYDIAEAAKEDTVVVSVGAQ